jgi:hypothetical protein
MTIYTIHVDIVYFLIDIKVQFSHGHRNMLILFIFLIDIKNTGIPLLFVSEMNDSVSLVIAVLHLVTKIEDTKAELPQLNCTQFTSMGIFVSKKIGNRKK